MCGGGNRPPYRSAATLAHILTRDRDVIDGRLIAAGGLGLRRSKFSLREALNVTYILTRPDGDEGGQFDADLAGPDTSPGSGMPLGMSQADRFIGQLGATTAAKAVNDGT